ncbi:M20/M25/M40 family metallo-hydrolase [Sphingomonas naphthae]|uniref:M20/M25/M40 family metallo-hydrolase n=1 Tax=Sphingomonas naphthae TaxID=1813468 RepID=A0ABY7TKC9_9SPHN|nr:M20/M25/M40 family metallo-hydrolase [Sphingomonas naphthae]WCT73416.1 M20/M25/M40 family metallo-hydrolase [Sphingomonas naphthae]
MADLAAVSARPHIVGSPEDAKVRAYLARRMAALGLTVSTQNFPLPEAARKEVAGWIGRDVDALTGTNVIGVMAGRDRAAPALLLMAHHDTVWGSPGAGDDGFGVAALLEIARALKAGPQPARDVILLFTDAEEVGLVGAKAWFADPANAARVGAIVNFEARGGGGRVSMFETSPGNGAAMRLFARVVPHPSAQSIAVSVYRLMPNSTDLTVALPHGATAFNFAPVGRAGLYHSPLATPANIDPATLHDMGLQGLGLTRALAMAPALPPRTADAAFGDVFGLGLLVYPAWAGWIVLAVAAGLFALAIGRVRPGWGGIGRGLVAALWLVPHGALLLLLVNHVSGVDWNYYDRLAALPRLEVQAALLALAAIALSLAVTRPLWPTPRWAGLIPALLLSAAALLLGDDPLVVAILGGLGLATGWFVHRTGLWEGWLGAILLVLLLVALVQALLPTAAPPFAWGLLLASLAAALTAWVDRDFTGGAGVIAAAIVAALALGNLLPFAHFLFLSVGADRAEVTILFALMALMLLRPLIALPPRALLIGGAALGVVATGIALSVLLDPMAPSVATYSLRPRG